MADVKVSGLPADTSPTVDDLMLTVDSTNGETRKITITDLIELISSNLVDGTVGSEKLLSTVAFRLTSTQSITNGASADMTGTEEYDLGGNLVHTTGIFTAPYDGTYQFNLVAGFDNTTNTTPTAARIDATILVNGVTKARGHGTAINTNADPTANCSVTLKLVAGDTVKTNVSNNTGGTEALSDSSFSGFLVGQT